MVWPCTHSDMTCNQVSEPGVPDAEDGSRDGPQNLGTGPNPRVSKETVSPKSVFPFAVLSSYHFSLEKLRVFLILSLNVYIWKLKQ